MLDGDPPVGGCRREGLDPSERGRSGGVWVPDPPRWGHGVEGEAQPHGPVGPG